MLKSDRLVFERDNDIDSTDYGFAVNMQGNTVS